MLVVGGGPAGAAAAITARRTGIPVTILEQFRFPRFRPGESLHPGLEPLLGRLGARETVAEAGYFRHSGIWLDWGQHRGFMPFGEDARGPWLGFQAPRGDFDQRMLAVARNAGAVILDARANRIVRGQNGRVTGIETAQGCIETRYVVDATGPSHWLSRQLRVPMQKFSPRLVARYGYAEGVLPPQKLPCLCANQHGWTWAANLGKGLYQWTSITEPAHRPVGACTPPGWEHLRPCGTYGADVTWRIAAQTAGEGWFLCGDAGAVLDPSSSHGVLRAVMSGMMAGHLAACAIRGEVPPSEAAFAYRDWFGEWFRHDSSQMSQAYREAGLFGF